MEYIPWKINHPSGIVVVERHPELRIVVRQVKPPHPWTGERALVEKPEATGNYRLAINSADS